jgi:hypothetical protein
MSASLEQHSAMPRLSAAAGLCLIEALIATMAGAVVLTAALQSLDHFERRLWRQIERIDREQETRIGLKILTDELRLAGTGAMLASPGMIKAEPQDVEFLANLDGLVTTLLQPAVANTQLLVVNDGTDWPKGKHIVVCGEERCREGRLNRAGQRNLLTLVDPLHETFQVGHSVVVSNTVRYYVGKNRTGSLSLMRDVDGGANPLINDVTWLRLSYMDRKGKPTSALGRIARIRIELALGGQPHIISEVGLRGQT